jgi:hypothetical protein
MQRKVAINVAVAGAGLSVIFAPLETSWPRPGRHGRARQVHSHGNQVSALALGCDVGKGARHSGFKLVPVKEGF